MPGGAAGSKTGVMSTTRKKIGAAGVEDELVADFELPPSKIYDAIPLRWQGLLRVFRKRICPFADTHL
jgi:hypothetical protein